MSRRGGSLAQRVRDNTSFLKSRAQRRIYTNDVHPKTKEGWPYGWEIQPYHNDQQWGMRVAAPCLMRETNEIGGFFGLIAVSHAVVSNYTDFFVRYNEQEHVRPALVRLSAGKPKWFPVKLLRRPEVGPGEMDPLEGLVRESFQQWEHKGLHPLVRIEDLLVTHG